MPASILYFHGFASSPQSTKLLALRDMLEPELSFDAPDLNVPSPENLQFEVMVQLGVDHGRRTPPRAIVGSSLGAMVALEVVRRGVRAPLVLIAPAIGIGDQWTHPSNEKALVHRTFFDEMCSVHADAEAPVVPVSVVMGRQDESIPFVIVRTRWEQWVESGQLVTGSRFIEIAGGDHSLTAWVGVIGNEIRAAAFHTF